MASPLEGALAWMGVWSRCWGVEAGRMSRRACDGASIFALSYRIMFADKR
jgi:hypothetical protein